MRVGSRPGPAPGATKGNCGAGQPRGLGVCAQPGRRKVVLRAWPFFGQEEKHPDRAPKKVTDALTRLYRSKSATDLVTPSPSAWAELWPSVDWRRYHLQVLFVDRTDTVRARLAAGLFERCAEWNGYGRALYPWTSGMTVSAAPDVSKLAALARGAEALEISLRTFSRPKEAFELEDLDRFDLVLALDSGVLAEIQQQVLDEHSPGPDRQYYMQKVVLLTNFSHYESDSVLTRKGGFALLPSKLSVMLKPELKASKQVVDIPTPDLSGPDAAKQWDATVAALILATASLVKYLIDAIPENLPDWAE